MSFVTLLALGAGTVLVLAVWLLRRAKRRARRRASIHIVSSREERDWRPAVYAPKQFRSKRRK